MQIRLKVDKAALKVLERNIAREVARIAESVTLKTYNAIALGEYPYWSGSYISSWNISQGSVDRSYNEPDRGSPGKYAAPSPTYELPFKVQLGQTIYISNSTPHAYMVESMGTPRHVHEGWYTAHHAVNQVVLSYRFSMTS